MPTLFTIVCHIVIVFLGYPKENNPRLIKFMGFDEWTDPLFT